MNWEEIKKEAWAYATGCADEAKRTYYSIDSNQNKINKIRQDFYLNKLGEYIIWEEYLQGKCPAPSFTALKKPQLKVSFETEKSRIRVKVCPPNSINNYGAKFGFAFSTIRTDPIFKKSTKNNIIFFVVCYDEDKWLVYGRAIGEYIIKNLVVTKDDYGNKNKKYFKIYNDSIFDKTFFDLIEKEVTKIK